MKKVITECLGTFILIFFETGTAVLGNGMEGVETAGIALAFGLTIVAAAYNIGTIPGAHLNPTIPLGMWLSKRIAAVELIYCVVGQIVGGLVVSFALLSILKGAGKSVKNLGQNDVGELDVAGALTVKTILTFIFILVVTIVTSARRSNASLAEIVIGLTLAMIHLADIPLTETSVNPAHNIAPAVFTNGSALSELWIFIVAPLIGELLAALVIKLVLDTEE